MLSVYLKNSGLAALFSQCKVKYNYSGQYMYMKMPGFCVHDNVHDNAHILCACESYQM